MQLNLIEQDIRNREVVLSRCKTTLGCLLNSPDAANTEYKKAIDLMEQEIFFLSDQLDKYYSVFTFLKEEQGFCDEVLPKV